MSILVQFGKEVMSKAARRIKCPLHFGLKPGRTGFVMERNPFFKHLKEIDAHVIRTKSGPNVAPLAKNFSLWIKKKDQYGRPIRNPDDYYQPEISAAFARENILKLGHPICTKCRRCIIK